MQEIAFAAMSQLVVCLYLAIQLLMIIDHNYITGHRPDFYYRAHRSRHQYRRP